MKVVIQNNEGGDQVFDSDKVPIMLVLEDFDIQMIGLMSFQRRYACFPEGTDVDAIREWVQKYVPNGESK